MKINLIVLALLFGVAEVVPTASPGEFRCQQQLGIARKIGRHDQISCYRTIDTIKSEEIILADAKDGKKGSKVMVSVAGLKMSREGLWVVSLTAANVFMFMLICWYKRRCDQKIEIILEEQRASFYKQIMTHSKLVMDIYKEVDDLNEQVLKTSGKNLAPMVKYIVDDTVKELPKRKAIAPVRSAPPP